MLLGVATVGSRVVLKELQHPGENPAESLDSNSSPAGRTVTSPAAARSGWSLAKVRSVAAQLAANGVVKGGLDLMRSMGGSTADHVDLLMNEELVTTVLTVAGGGQTEDNVVSNIRDISRHVAAAIGDDDDEELLT